MFKSVEARMRERTDGRRLDWYTISSPRAFGSGELKTKTDLEGTMILGGRFDHDHVKEEDSTIERKILRQ